MTTRTRPALSTSAQLEQSDAPVASSLYEDSRRKEVFCSYCEKKGHKETQCRKKYRDAKERKGARPTTAGAQIAIVNESGLSNCQAKDKNPARRQSLVVVLVGHEV